MIIKSSEYQSEMSIFLAPDIGDTIIVTTTGVNRKANDSYIQEHPSAETIQNEES